MVEIGVVVVAADDVSIGLLSMDDETSTSALPAGTGDSVLLTLVARILS